MRTHLSLPRRHLSKREGFDVCGSAGAIANGRLPARPGHREGRFWGIETEATFIENQKALNFDAKFNFRRKSRKSDADVATETARWCEYLI